MTYSLIAFDPASGQLGSLVASRWTSVGSCVPYVRQGVGLMHIQHCANPGIAEACLDSLTRGHSVVESLKIPLQGDANRESRQCILANFSGEFALFSGTACRPISATAQGTHCAAAGNMITTDAVVADMVTQYEASMELPLPERLLACIDAAELAGGDRRGRESVSLRIFDPQYPSLHHFLPDLRVDNHESPGEELKRLYQCFCSEERSITPS